MAGGGRFTELHIHFTGRAWDAHLGRELDEVLNRLAASTAILSGSPGVPEPVALGDESEASAGTTQTPAVSDHIHNLETDAPSVATGKTASEGTASSVLRSDARIAQGVVTTKGDLLTHDGATAERFESPGIFGYKLISEPGSATGLGWEPIGFQRAQVKTADYTIETTDGLILVDATAGPVTITLPDPTLANIQVTVKKIDASANAVTIDGDGVNIDGSGTQSLTAQYQAVTMASEEDTAQWWIVSFSI